MSYLKGLTSKDVIVSPLTIHKTVSRTAVSTFADGLNTPIQLRVGNDKYITGSATGSAPLVYNSIKQLYYGNYISSSDGLLNTASLPQYNEDGTIEGPVFNNLYENNISSITEIRKWPPSDSSDTIRVLSIPRSLFGDSIRPGSFDSLYYQDRNGDGNIVKKSDDSHAGNIIYGAGLVISDDSNIYQNPTWDSSYTLYETQYKCTVEASEFNFSMNPSLLSSSINGQAKIRESGSAFYADYVTGSDFTPFVTTVGLYNDNKELMAVGKLAQPLALSQHVDTTILINIDR